MTQSKAQPQHTFAADDFDLTGYDAVQLAFVCDHRIVLVSRFPKLVVALFHAPRFVGWMKQNDTMRSSACDTATLVTCIVAAVQHYTSDYQGQLNRTRVDWNDAALWKAVRQSCTLRAGAPRANTDSDAADTHVGNDTATDTAIDVPDQTGGDNEAIDPHRDESAKPNDIARGNHEVSVLQRVHKTLKPYHYWKDTSMPMVEIDVRAPVHQPHLYQQYRRRTRKQQKGGAQTPQPQSQPQQQQAAARPPLIRQHQSRVISL